MEYEKAGWYYWLSSPKFLANIETILDGNDGSIHGSLDKGKDLF